MSKIHILKFGGTSLQDASFINQAVEVVKNTSRKARPFIVVSAIAGVTDRLIALSKIPAGKSAKANKSLSELRNLHTDLLTRLGGSTAECFEKLNALFDELRGTYFDDHLRTAKPGAWRDHILSIGERASAHLFASVLSARQLPSVPVETQHYIKTDATFGEANIIPKLTRNLLADALNSLDKVAVITGFIGSTKHREITTLGRSGSDYTAGLIADALNADHLEIWTDVDGVLTADPKIVPAARNLEYLSFEDISELSAHGAKVIHPKTIHPIRERDISIQVRNSHQPQQSGTLIKRSHASNGDFRSLTVTGPYVYFEVPDPLAKDFSELLEQQTGAKSGSDGFSFSRISRFEPAQFVIKEEVFRELKDNIEHLADRKGIEPVISENLYRVNTFTNKLRQSDLAVTQILQLLYKKGIRPKRIHREPNRRYFSLLFPETEARRAANLINEYLVSDTNRTDIFLAGVGAVGSKLLQLIDEFNSEDVSFNVIGLCNSTNTLWNNRGLHSADLDNGLDKGGQTDWPAIVDKLIGGDWHHTIFVDATGSEEVARLYPGLLEAGIHVVSPSKLANTFEQSYYDLLREKASAKGSSFRYETNVGAGLPIISTINDLLDSGDSITELSGVLSGTMTYLFNKLEEGTPFSEAVLTAKKLGYAEPDPRDDLSGEDVARKFLTLAREIGLRIERDDLEVESLIPGELKNLDRESFLERLPEFDEYWRNRLDEAASKGETLRYTGKLKDGKIRIGVESLPMNSSLGQLKGTDNMLRIFSLRYAETPLIIQGAGAGREVTAAGVLNDILKITKEH
ncbi:MAG TPA: aspartate kinase [Halalkalibaculum sp.]|nr:aspartate kinase [Halalkalibaculum sp.]